MAHARVDASFTKSKLMRMKKPELLEACQDLGLSAEGTKEQISETILEHFEGNAEEDIKPGEQVMMQQAAAVATRPVPLPPKSQPAPRKGNELEAQIKALDATILAKTQELEELRLEDMSAMDTIIQDHKDLKESFTRNLKDTSKAMEDVLELQQTCAKVAELQAEQANLNQSIKGLSRLLTQREEEISSLRAQLNEMRASQRQEEKKVANERYALVALASQMATMENGGGATSARSVAAAATATAAPPSVAMQRLSAAMALPSAVRSRTRAVPENSDTRVFGASFPGLVLLETGNLVYLQYSQVRDSVVNTVPQRILADLGTAAFLLAAASLAS